MKDALESRYGVRLDGDRDCIPWLVAHASDSITRFHVHPDGRTGYHNWKGRPFKKECVEFGECIMYNPPGRKGNDKFMNRWEEGVWLGIADRTNEVIVGTSEGVIKVRDVRRHAADKDRWDLIRFNAFQGVPWEPIPGRNVDTIPVRVRLAEEGEAAPEPANLGEPRAISRRRMRITRKQIVKIGFTVGCPGCRAVNRGLPAVDHSEECRRRFEHDVRGAEKDKCRCCPSLVKNFAFLPALRISPAIMRNNFKIT